MRKPSRMTGFILGQKIKLKNHKPKQKRKVIILSRESARTPRASTRNAKILLITHYKCDKLETKNVPHKKYTKKLD